MDTKKVKLYKFYADWCQPCKQQTKLLEETPVNVELIPINVDEQIEKAAQFGVRGLPALILVDDEDNIIKSWHKLTMPSEINTFLNESGL